MHHLTPRAPPICRKDHPCIERSASHLQLFPLTMGDRRWARAGRAVPTVLGGYWLVSEHRLRRADQGVVSPVRILVVYSRHVG